MRYSYPGNVRQLANILEYATIISGNGLIDVDDLPDEVAGVPEPQEQPQGLSEEFLATTSLKELERLAVIATLKKNNGRRDKTADDLGISKRGLLNKIKEYGIQ